ncbi:MAG: hypothetical protein IKP51_11560 [Treponema sp.]|nr:hypothetical protein [Treponema sp.]
MKKAFLTLLSLTAATLLLLLTPSCSGLVSPTVPDSDSESTPNAESQRYTLSGSFSMPSADAAPQEISALSSPQRNAIPDTSSLTYTVEAKRSDGYTETTASDGSTYTFTNLTAGTWQITAYATTTGGTRVMQSETKSVTLSNANPYATTSLTMAPASGSGNIALTINWATDSGIGYCEWSSSDSPALAGSAESTSGSVTINLSELSASNYLLTLSFYTSLASKNAGLPPVYECTEYISVYPGLMTNKWTAGTAPHISASGDFSVTPACVESFVYRKIYVSQGASTSTATGTSERPFATIEQAMARLNEAASNGIRSGQITATTPWELHVTGTITATEPISGDALIRVDDTIAYLAIIGEGSGATIDADKKGTIVYVGGDASVSMQTVTLKNGYDPTSTVGGGGVYIDAGTFTMNSGTITSSQTVNGGGGGVYVATGGEFVMNNGTISANKAIKGNGVYVDEDGIFTMNSGTISANTNNTSTYEGGGVYCDGIFTMTNGTITGNTATHGKGVYIDANGEFTMNGGSITSNTGSTGSGGGVYTCGTFTMNNGTISANSATGGNGVWVTSSDGEFTMNGGTISANSGQSGAVYVNTGAEFTMNSGSTISSNLYSGGVYISGSSTSGGTFTMNGGTISGNTATTDGGGVYVGNGAIFDMHDGTIKGNTALGLSEHTGEGGGVYTAGTFTMTGGTIGGTSSDDANEAQGSSKRGGGVYVAINTFNMQGGTITGNTTEAGGQGSGVYVENNGTILFSMKGDARVAPSNDVYLYYNKITIAGKITATSPVATITPTSYASTSQVLDIAAPTSPTTTIEKEYKKFAVTEKTNEIWIIRKTGELFGFTDTATYNGNTYIGMKANTADDLVEFMEVLNSCYGDSASDTSNLFVSIEADITLGSDYTPYGCGTKDYSVKPGDTYGVFKGVFDGKGHTITVGEINTKQFSVICAKNEGIIQNVKLSSSVSLSTDDDKEPTPGYYFSFGAICGINGANGIIRNCWNDVSVNDLKLFNRGGGICRDNHGIIENCINTGNFNCTMTHQWGGIYGVVGGICAYNSGTVKNCVNYGKIQLPTTYLSSSDISGLAGSICGYIGSGVVQNCYWLKDCVYTGKSPTWQNVIVYNNSKVRKGTVSGCGYFEGNNGTSLSAGDATSCGSAQTLTNGSNLLSALTKYVTDKGDSNLKSWKSGGSYSAVLDF